MSWLLHQRKRLLNAYDLVHAQTAGVTAEITVSIKERVGIGANALRGSRIKHAPHLHIAVDAVRGVEQPLIQQLHQFRAIVPIDPGIVSLVIVAKIVWCTPA